MTATDTICAVATPLGRGGIGVVRVSGPAVRRLAEALVGGPLQPRRASFRRFLGARGEVIDEGNALFFPAPASFTGEDVLELQGHGAPIVMDRLLQRLSALGARLARPGEFSERAFLNGRLDLAQAEAIADLIEARTEAGARAAMRSLSGDFSRQVEALVATVTELRVYVESAIDFSDEELDFLDECGVSDRLAETRRRLGETLAAARRGRVLREGVTVVIAGRPNVGKSSLLNRLAGADAAIVTEVAGTTRDLLREQIQLDGLPLQVVDTAGLRESGDLVEREGVRRAHAAVAAADRVLLVVDDRDGAGAAEAALVAELAGRPPVTLIRNKVDLTGRAPGTSRGAYGPEVALSARDGRGLEALAAHLKREMGYEPEASDFTARRRHLEALERADAHLNMGVIQLEEFAAGELVAEELRLAQNALAEITGRVTSEDLLGRIFSTFCIGK